MQGTNCRAFENLQELAQATGEHGVVVRSIHPIEVSITSITLSGFVVLEGD